MQIEKYIKYSFIKLFHVQNKYTLYLLKINLDYREKISFTGDKIFVFTFQKLFLFCVVPAVRMRARELVNT